MIGDLVRGRELGGAIVVGAVVGLDLTAAIAGDAACGSAIAGGSQSLGFLVSWTNQAYVATERNGWGGVFGFHPWVLLLFQTIVGITGKKRKSLGLCFHLGLVGRVFF